jgi:hypothetical protein
MGCFTAASEGRRRRSRAARSCTSAPMGSRLGASSSHRVRGHGRAAPPSSRSSTGSERYSRRTCSRSLPRSLAIAAHARHEGDTRHRASRTPNGLLRTTESVSRGQTPGEHCHRGRGDGCRRPALSARSWPSWYPVRAARSVWCRGVNGWRWLREITHFGAPARRPGGARDRRFCAHLRHGQRRCSVRPEVAIGGSAGRTC